MRKEKVAILILMVMVGSIGFLGTDVEHGSATLNKFESYGELREFLQYRNPSYDSGWYLLDKNPGTSLAFKDSYGLDYSKTNIQVEGVDEADIVKTDGQYLYVISGQKVVIIKTYPAEEAAILSKITAEGTLQQLFINEERLAIFYENSSSEGTQTFLDIYDVSDRTNPLLKNEISVDGQYFSSRMIGNHVYLIATKSAWVDEDGEVNLPKICFEDKHKVVPATEIYYSDTNDYYCLFTTIVAVNVFEDGQPPVDETILLGWTSTIYVSLENIYLVIDHGYRTILHRIHIKYGEISYVADGEVQGKVLNQFSMDEYGGYFRIATTSQMTVSPGEPSPILRLQNNIYILDENLTIVGKLEAIAPGEQIHSARFMGATFFLVTFRKIDPFFVFDLSDPYEPKILGELKITGYSDYLHLYDENHVIGVGKETIAAEIGDFSWYQGVKISLFDVTNMTDPKELAKYEIGDRGTDSPVLQDHKAFLFDKEKSLLVLPVSVAEIDQEQYPNGIPPNAYGNTVWQGAYIFAISLEIEEKIVLKGKITHVENGEIGNTAYHVTRAFYIEEVLYTISESKVKMNSLLDLSEINELNLKE